MYAFLIYLVLFINFFILDLLLLLSLCKILFYFCSSPSSSSSCYYTVVNGQWSSWTSDTPGLCDNTCVRKLDFARTCSKPPPSPGGKECKGIEVKVTTEACMGGKCRKTINSYPTKNIYVFDILYGCGGQGFCFQN